VKFLTDRPHGYEGIHGNSDPPLVSERAKNCIEWTPSTEDTVGVFCTESQWKWGQNTNSFKYNKTQQNMYNFNHLFDVNYNTFAKFSEKNVGLNNSSFQ